MSAAEPNQDDLDRFVSTKYIAAKTDYSPRTYERWRTEGTGPPYVRLNNGRCRYHLRTALEHFLKRQRGEA
jgi:hypothetical protein